jgi:hypothetical protein
MSLETYKDEVVSLGADGLTIAWYYPWGPKHVRYGDVRAVERTDLTALGGRYRLWGSTTLRYWANLDLRRPTKKVGFILELGAHVSPFITPDDPDAFERVLRSHLPGVDFRATSGTAHVI